MFDYQYRLWFLKQLAESFLPPIAVVFLASRITAGFGAHVVPRTSVYIVAIPLFWVARHHYTRWRVEAKARRLGVPLPPLIQGKKLGNIDLLRR